MMRRMLGVTTRGIIRPVAMPTVRLLARAHGGAATHDPSKQLVHMTFVTPAGERIDVAEPEGTNILIAAHRHGVDLEGATRLVRPAQPHSAAQPCSGWSATERASFAARLRLSSSSFSLGCCGCRAAFWPGRLAACA